MGFWSFGDLRTLLDTETDNDSPGSEELISQIRENIEALFMLILGTGVSGTATANPSNDTNGFFYDTASTWTDDQHNGRTLLIKSGAAKGNTYTIDDTVDSSGRLACTGDNLYADGVRSGDTYIILYDIKNNADGHDHDNINSTPPVLANNYIANIKLKTVGTSVSGSGSAIVDIAMQDYCFFPNVWVDGADNTHTMSARATDTADYTGRFNLYAQTAAYIVRFRYVTASDEPFVYMVREKATGKVLHCWMGEDPPPGYWGLSETPKDFERPVIAYTKDGKPEFDPEKHEEIISWKVKKDLWQAIKDRQKADKKKPPHRVLEETFEYDKKARIWKTKNLIAV
jgi:hypothetical protein